MARYRATFRTHIEVVVEIDAMGLSAIEAEDVVPDEGWVIAEAYLQTLGTQTGDQRIVSVEASLDGIGADSVEVQS